jgi:hypothetical protein
MTLPTITKLELITKLKAIRDSGWIKNTRGSNNGAVGNMLEDLLGIPENNLPIANAAEWELKTQRSTTSSLVTLFHSEPSPTSLKIVAKILLPDYGWSHAKAGNEYDIEEKSFRQTIRAGLISDRGFTVQVNSEEEKIEVVFDFDKIEDTHIDWRYSLASRNLQKLPLNPYWGFNDVTHKAGTKLRNCFFVIANTQKINSIEHFHYNKIYMLSNFSHEKFIYAVKQGKIFIDFDARTGHNHGTKFRIKNNNIVDLYETALEI